MPWNGEATGGGGSGGGPSPTTTTPSVYSLRSRNNVLKKHEPSRPKPKPKPKQFKPSKALREEILSLVVKPKHYSPPADWDLDNSDLDTSDDFSPVPAAEFPLSTVYSRTPKVIDHLEPSLKELTQANIKRYGVMAKLALEYYNFEQHANLKLVEVIVASVDSDSVTRMHINFIASSHGDSQSLLFAELINDSFILEADLSGYYVQGCCVIEKVDSANPFGYGCTICSKEVQHPGPAWGYRIVSGDLFKGYSFWNYHPFAYKDLSGPRVRPLHSAKSAKLALYAVSAKKALEYFNSEQQQVLFQPTKFKDAEVTAGADCPEDGTIVHINFMAQLLSGYGSEKELFFAVLSIPQFNIERGWEDWKEPFVKVEACCRLEKVDSGNPFGRVCGICRLYGYGTIVHPSPRDGHTAADGDDFAGYDFMNMSTGIY